MFVRFKANWKYAERGIHLRHFEAGKQYRESDKCSDTEIDTEGAVLALDLGIAEMVDDKPKQETPEPTPEPQEQKKPQSSGQPRRSGKGRRSR